MKLKLNVLQISMMAFLFLAIAFLACNKERSGEGTPEEEEAASVASTESDGEAQAIYSDVFDDVMGVNSDVALGSTGIFGRNAAVGTEGTDATARVLACPDVTITLLNPPALFPKKVVLDFGTGCTSQRDGRHRRGKIIITYTNRLTIPGAMATTVFDGYYIDSLKIEGTHKITNITEVNALAKKWKVEVIGGRISHHNGNFTEWSHTHIITHFEGLSTTNVRDWVLKIEGHGAGRTKRNGIIVAWNSEIIEPLIKRFNCRWIVKGKVRIRRANISNSTRWEGVLDFSPPNNGQCDNRATITVNGHTREIILR
jgi:hypothetical protein